VAGLYSGETVTFVLLGALIEWPGQLAVLVCLRLVAGKSTPLERAVGLAEVDPVKDSSATGGIPVLQEV